MTALQARLAAFALSALLGSCASPIVGAECRPGFVRCDGACVDVRNDPANCGECGHDCGRLECRKSSCGPGPRPDFDGGAVSPGDGGDRDGGDGGSPSGVTPGGSGSPFLPDGGLSFPDPMVDQGCALGEADCGGTCANLQIDAQHCGECGIACPAGQYCSLGMCKDVCDDPLVLCNGQCVDLQTSPYNCGSCGRECASGICEAGMCQDVIPGQLVVFGHDYSASQLSSTMKRLAGNALFLAPGAPVAALSFRGSAVQSSVDGVNAAIDYVVAADGRAWTRVPVDEATLTEQLYGANALIIHAQARSSDDMIRNLGQRWGLALSQFLLRGGVVLLFDTDSATNSGTYKLLAPAGLFEAGSRAKIAQQTLTVVSPGIGVATRTTRNYRSAGTTVHFLDVTSPSTVVVRDRDGEAVIVHRVISP